MEINKDFSESSPEKTQTENNPPEKRGIPSSSASGQTPGAQNMTNPGVRPVPGKRPVQTPQQNTGTNPNQGRSIPRATRSTTPGEAEGPHVPTRSIPGAANRPPRPAGTRPAAPRPNPQGTSQAQRPAGAPNNPQGTNARPVQTQNPQNTTARPVKAQVPQNANSRPVQAHTNARPGQGQKPQNTGARPVQPQQQNVNVPPANVQQPQDTSASQDMRSSENIGSSLLKASMAAAEAVPDKSRPSVLRPTAPLEDAASTRVIPATGRPGQKNSDETIESPKKKQKNSSMRERLREEGNNAVISLVKAAIYLVCVLLISTIISMTVIMVGNDIFAFVKSEDTVSVVIPENADIDSISKILAENGLIKYPSVFRIYAGDQDKDYGKYAGIFVAGTYELSPSMDYEDLLAAFKPKTPAGTSWITIPEGFTTDEIIDLLIEKGIGSIDVDEDDKYYSYYSQFTDLRDAYEDVINNYNFNYWFVDALEEGDISKDRIYRLDGYLFPDTYEFYNASRPHAVINKFLARFSQIFTEEYRALAEQSGYSVDEIIILASMVEKEANNAADYFNVSEVFRNRLENPAAQNTYTLDSDATVLYYIHHITGERPTKTTPEDTKMEVPYNTYLNQGLPPGPISNPSATAILAALNPSNEGYYFFITGNKDTYFTRTFYDHQYYISIIASGLE